MALSRASTTLLNLAMLANFPSLLNSSVFVEYAKWTTVILVLLNIRSFPLSWHIGVFKPLLQFRLPFLLRKATLVLASGKNQALAINKWWDARTPAGADPFTTMFSLRRWAGPDDCDFFMHLSNSSYAKVLDSGRFQVAVEWYPQFVRVGGVKALGGTFYTFWKEIPIFSKYEIRISVGSWDEKWLYVICRFVTPPRKGGRVTNCDDAKSKIAVKLVSSEPDGYTLHAISVSQSCFKIGRITVPPAIAFATNGFCDPENKHLRTLVSPEHGGSEKKLRDFMIGGWRDIPGNERWWEQTLGGEVEKQRKERLVLLKGLKDGMEGSREMHY